jgi:membrane protein implicated in regulation of membrane protease activity
MQELYPMLGYWFWWIVAGILLFVELMLPGIFFMWLAFAAASIGIVTYFLTLAWEVEALMFAGLAVVYVYLAAPWYSKNRHIANDQPNLNQRIYGFVGKNYVLVEPIVHGHGKLDIDGTRWELLGPDLAAGSKVHVTSVEGMRLRVREG